MLATLHAFIDAGKNQRPPFGGLSDFRTNLFKSMVCHGDFSRGNLRNGDLVRDAKKGANPFALALLPPKRGLSGSPSACGNEVNHSSSPASATVRAVCIGKIALIDATIAEYRAFPLSRIGHPE